MDAAVALVQAYLRVNGYFTVAEYPVLEAGRAGVRTATDIDVLAVRFPGAGRQIAGAKPHTQKSRFEPDPVLGAPADVTDMLIGEVKEGRARLNPAMRDHRVLAVALARFGCCSPNDAERSAEALVRRGHVTTSCGHRARVVAFGTLADPASNSAAHTVVKLGHVTRFLQAYLREHWDVLHHAQFKDEMLSILTLLEKTIGSGLPPRREPTQSARKGRRHHE